MVKTTFLTYVQGLNDFNDVTFVFDDIQSRTILNTGETEKHHKKYDFNYVTFAFNDVQSRREKLQRMWGKYFVTEETEETSEKASCTGNQP